jgi:hypothetical protein
LLKTFQNKRHQTIYPGNLEQAKKKKKKTKKKTKGYCNKNVKKQKKNKKAKNYT